MGEISDAKGYATSYVTDQAAQDVCMGVDVLGLVGLLTQGPVLMNSRKLIGPTGTGSGWKLGTEAERVVEEGGEH